MDISILVFIVVFIFATSSHIHISTSHPTHLLLLLDIKTSQLKENFSKGPQSNYMNFLCFTIS